MNQKHKKACRSLNYFEHFLIFISAVSCYVSVSEFVSLVGVSVGLASSLVVVRTCAVPAGIKRYKSVIKKKRKKDNKIVLLARTSISKTLIE